jgi:hypothetical protein
MDRKAVFGANVLAAVAHLIVLVEASVTEDFAVVRRLVAFVPVNPLVTIRAFPKVLFVTTLTSVDSLPFSYGIPHIRFLEILVAVSTSIVVLAVTSFTDQR